MAKTALSLACDMVVKAGRDNKVQACKFPPRGGTADTAVRWFGTNRGWCEFFISKGQAEFLAKLMGEESIVTAGTEDDPEFCAFIKEIYSERKGQNYWLLVYAGDHSAVEEERPAPAPARKPVEDDDERWQPDEYDAEYDEPAPARKPAPAARKPAPAPAPAVPARKPVTAGPAASPVEKSGTSDRANRFAAVLIRGAVEKGYHQKDAYARSGEDDYLVAWLSKAQADALARLLPDGVVREDGSFLTQAAGPFAYWGKKRTQSGAQLLCWMGEPPAVEDKRPAPAPARQPATATTATASRTRKVPGKVIPEDLDIPF